MLFSSHCQCEEWTAPFAAQPELWAFHGILKCLDQVWDWPNWRRTLYFTITRCVRKSKITNPAKRLSPVDFLDPNLLKKKKVHPLTFTFSLLIRAIFRYVAFNWKSLPLISITLGIYHNFFLKHTIFHISDSEPFCMALLLLFILPLISQSYWRAIAFCGSKLLLWLVECK